MTTEVFVYGTLKKGGSNHHFLKDSDFVRHEILKDHAIYQPNQFGFPLLIESKGDKVYGEVYRITSTTLAKLDMLESEGYLYTRVNDSKLGFQYYLFNKEYGNVVWDEELDKIASGYWKTKREVDLNLIIDNRNYTDKADKLVFHLRFFDGQRTPTNKIYMDMVKRRSHLDLNTEDEEIFLRDCIINGVVTEFKEPIHNYRLWNEY
jgi:gamma-glutamylcyclotransferase (GGCT)/AIG2-like uncharacterized protein YtfP